ncbi:Serine/threonine-protein phosphatase 5 [Symbiodinium microadriaticum]|uniref:Serine/threonine-protein phosphatase 5 n=1 Tax=Symbiodinium microadriaticum TaxID=2951 RepID=A0A1Q9F196_SYMMI|nr:Serine/threonine-protein phosphatase 5 [Symbiodinium microadriaticum]
MDAMIAFARGLVPHRMVDATDNSTTRQTRSKDAHCCSLLPEQLAEEVQHDATLGGGPDVPVPKYPGAADREKMREFAEQLQDFYRAGGQLAIGDLMALLQDAETFGPQFVTLHLFFTQQKALVYVEAFDGWLVCEENPFLFNGDFVDRGILLAWKLACPEHMHLARGNHEAYFGREALSWDADMNFSYGFTGEVLAKYRAQLAVWAAFQRVFLTSPEMVEGTVFLVFGRGLPEAGVDIDVEIVRGEGSSGLALANWPQEDTKLADIEALDVMEITRSLEERKMHKDYDLMSDLMSPGWFESDVSGLEGVSTGDRGQELKLGPTTIVFGEDVTQRFLERNSLSFMIRSHEVKEQGYEWQHGKRCLTENYIRCMEFTQPGLTEQPLDINRAGLPFDRLGTFAAAPLLAECDRLQELSLPELQEEPDAQW